MAATIQTSSTVICGKLIDRYKADSSSLINVLLDALPHTTGITANDQTEYTIAYIVSIYALEEKLRKNMKGKTVEDFAEAVAVLDADRAWVDYDYNFKQCVMECKYI
jgi:hypothetical protein